MAIARALANNPPMLLADEPTGNLDTTSSQIVLDAFRKIQRDLGTTVILVTHDMDIAATADRIIRIVDGRVAEDAPAAAVVPPLVGELA